MKNSYYSWARAYLGYARPAKGRMTFSLSICFQTIKSVMKLETK